MANYPFRINIATKSGRTIAYYSPTFATDADTAVSASTMVDDINLLQSASYEDGTTTPDSYPAGGGYWRFGGTYGAANIHLSASYITSPNTGSVVFTDEESATDSGLDYYTFWGTKVCNVLGLPEGIPIYTETFKLSDDSSNPSNYLSGDVIADGVAIKESFKMAPQGRMRSNLVWDHQFGEGFLQWVSGSASKLLFGYDDQADTYSLSAASVATFNISGVDSLTASSINSPKIWYTSGGSPTLDLLAGVLTWDDSATSDGQLRLDGQNGRNEMVGKLKLYSGEYTTYDNELVINDHALFITNRSSDNDDKIAGIGFDVGTVENSDAIMASIVVARDISADGDNLKHSGNLIFSTNDDGVGDGTNTADDSNYERMRITHDGNVGIGTTTPGTGTGAIASTLEIAGYYGRTAHHVGCLVGSYNNIATNAVKSNPIYIIGSSYEPTDAALGNMYGIGFCKSTATFIDSADNSWGLYVAGNGAARAFIAGTDGHDSYFTAGNIGIGITSPTALLDVYGGGNRTAPLVRFVHSEDTLDTGDTILDLDFDDDTTIGASNYYIKFQNQDGHIGSVDSEVAYSTFTGAHISQRPSGSDFSNWKPGMVVKSTGNMIQHSGSMSGSLSMAWPIVDITTTQKDKAIMGVFTSTTPAPVDNENYTTSSKFVGRVSGLDDNSPSINYNAVGEGKLLVTDTNGNIETGDYICSSTRTGHGEKQDDDLLHNYTVAKATQPYNFTSASNDADLGYKSVLIACTYHCG